jgi:FkbM family methyltransferase
MVDVGVIRGVVGGEAKRLLRSLCPQPVLNWREAQFYGRFGEVELHLLDILCRPEADAIDVGANDGSYVLYLRKHCRHVIGYEPMPALARALRQKFRRNVTIEMLALSDSQGTVELRMPVVDGVVVTGCSTVSAGASAAYPAFHAIEVAKARLDDVYEGDAGFIKIDVEGHQQAVLDGAIGTIRRCQPRMLVEAEERLSPGGLARVRAYFDALGYRGFFVWQGEFLAVDRFSIDRMQDPANLPDLTAPLTARQRFGRYVYNFIFFPPHEPDSTVERIRERLRTL